MSLSLALAQSLDELEDDDGGDRERKMEQQLVQANTVQNEAMTPSPGSPQSPGPPAHLSQVRPPPPPPPPLPLPLHFSTHQRRH